MESMDKKRENIGGRSSEDPREKGQQNPTLSPEELEKKTSQSEKNDLLNEDPDEERREIEKSSEDNLESAE